MPAVFQLADFLNQTLTDVGLGESAVVNADLTNIVDVGKTVTEWANDNNKYDTVIKKLLDNYSIYLFEDREYVPKVPDILKRKSEWGAILAKYKDVTWKNEANNGSWSLADYPVQGGDDYPDPFEITHENIKTTFWSDSVAFEVPYTIPFDQFKTAWTGAAEMQRFIAMIRNHAVNRMRYDLEQLVKLTIANRIGLNFAAHHGVINLLEIYNAAHPNAPITSAEALNNVDLLRDAMATWSRMTDYVQEYSMLYNLNGDPTFSRKDTIHAVQLSAFESAVRFNLFANTFNKSENESPVKIETIGSWLGSGTDIDDTVERSKIDITVTYDPTNNANGVRVVQDHIIGVIFDDWGCCVYNEDPVVTSQANNRGRYNNFWHQYKGSYMNDMGENCIVFTVSPYSWDAAANGESAPDDWATTYTNYVSFDASAGTYSAATSTWSATGNYYKIVATA